jgi:hypothetical protein
MFTNAVWPGRKQFMNAHKYRTGMVVLITLLLAASLIAAVSAIEEKGVVKNDASKAQLELINELYGKDITVLEYMEKVHPEHLVGVSDSIKKDMANQKMKWWGKEKSSPGQKSLSAIRGAAVSVTATGYKADWRTIHLGGTCTASGMDTPPGYIYVEAFLINVDTGVTADSTSQSSTAGVWSVTASKDKLYPDSGYQYKVQSWGYIPHPYREDSAETTVFNF